MRSYQSLLTQRLTRTRVKIHFVDKHVLTADSKCSVIPYSINTCAKRVHRKIYQAYNPPITGALPVIQPKG